MAHYLMDDNVSIQSDYVSIYSLTRENIHNIMIWQKIVYIAKNSIYSIIFKTMYP